MSKKTDLDLKRIQRNPDRSFILLTDGKNENQGFIIEHVELRQYMRREILP
jgi:hypothetical protein